MLCIKHIYKQQQINFEMSRDTIKKIDVWGWALIRVSHKLKVQ